MARSSWAAMSSFIPRSRSWLRSVICRHLRQRVSGLAMILGSSDVAALVLPQPIAEIWICSSLGDLHESLLDELCRSCHGIRIDLDLRQQVLVSPAMGLCGRAAKLDLHAALL